MCVIAYKAKSVRFPSESRVREMWEHNPDGAGVMWRDNATNRIKFVKGFMKLKHLDKWIAENREWLEEVECALHFRIATHGGISEGNCHPFVVDESVDSHLLEGEADSVLMHNGVLDINPRRKDISDSAELALRIGCYPNPSEVLGKFNEFLEGNRVLIFQSDGAHFFGDKFKESEDKDGILYSNLHWEASYRPFGYGGYSAYDYSGIHFTPKSVSDNAISEGPDCGWYWDAKRGCFIEMLTGSPVTDLRQIDPDFLSEDDYDVYFEECERHTYDRAFASGLVTNDEEFYDLEQEAWSNGVELDEYLDYQGVPA